MKYLILLLPFMWGCGGDYVDDKAMQTMLDSLNQSSSIFYAKYVSVDGKHFIERPTTFMYSDSSLEVTVRDGCTATYDLYEGGSKGATAPTTWNSSGYVENISIKVEKLDNKIASIQLNDHLFTNSPVPVVEEVVVSKVRSYTIKKGDTATKLRTFIPKDKIPTKLIIGQKITY